MMYILLPLLLLLFDHQLTEVSASAIPPDWLVTRITTASNLTTTAQGTLLLSNGLISREFTVKPDFTTIDYFSYEKQSSLLRALSPEAVVHIDGVFYDVGRVLSEADRAYMNRSALNDLKPDPTAFRFRDYTTETPTAPYSYRPKRGAPKDMVWPPKGLTLNVNFMAPDSAPPAHKNIVVTVHYEIYDGIPLLAKWISLTASISNSRSLSTIVGVASIENLALNQQWAGPKKTLTQTTFYDTNEVAWLYVQTDQSHGTAVSWTLDPEQVKLPGSFEPAVNVSYEGDAPRIPLTEDGFISFRVHELAIGSVDPERVALAKHRMIRLLAPQIQENPIFFHMTNSSSEAIRSVVDQMAEVGFEMLIYSFGSGFNIESMNKTYLARIKDDIAYANSKGIEVGGYDLIALTRQVKKDWAAVDPHTGKPTGNACFASGWYDYLLERFLLFIDYTGLSNVETDGPYGGYPCAATNHSHHTGLEDSVYYQQKLQGKFFKALREKEVYINQPDYFFYQGGSKTGLGYNEHQYSLPRWTDLSISRQSVYDDTYRLPPTAGWMFVPLTPYHTPGAEVVFEPLQEHLLEYEWALAQYLGAGVAACYRGYRVYDTKTTKAVVTKWVAFYKQYRDILTSDMVHIRRPDMQGLDSYMHVNPFIENRALAMVFNPTLKGISTELKFPLYYAGLTEGVDVRQEGGSIRKYQLDRDYSITVKVSLPARGITWYLIQHYENCGL